MKTYLIFLALILLSLTACKKDKHINGTGTPPPQQQQLPPITTEGKNTFGCLVNGNVWLPEVTPYQMFVYPLTSSYNPNIGLDVKATKNIDNQIYEGTSLQIINLDDTGVFILDSNLPIGSYGVYYDLSKGCNYTTDSIQIGTVEILKLDTSNKIIAGTFEMKLWKNGCDTINITEGRFDVKYAQ
jgi:hypothetical protein